MILKKGAGEADAIERIKKDLDIKEADFVSDEDLPLALEVFSFLHFCLPPNLIEATKMGIFFGRLLEKENMRTFVLSILNTILYENSKGLSCMDSVHKIFDELDKSYNFLLGPSILAQASITQLKQLAKRNFPFLKEFKYQIQHCLDESKCNTFTGLTSLAGKHNA